MFLSFFYTLREKGLPVSPTAFLALQKALKSGLINSLDDFYTAARSILVKSERYFDLYDKVFLHCFDDAELPDIESIDFTALADSLMDDWLKNPEELSDAAGLSESQLKDLSLEELKNKFQNKQADQQSSEDGDKGVGSGGKSPVGHSGANPNGVRAGGESKRLSALKTAGERRYRDYSKHGPLNQAMVGEALKRLRHLTPSGPRDQVNIDDSIYQTVKNAGEIQIEFEARLKDKLKVILMIDNGGWSMDPYVSVVQTLFDYARAQFKEIKTYYFHNTIQEVVWTDPTRHLKPKKTEEFSRFDNDTRLLMIGDASMAGYELLGWNGTYSPDDTSSHPNIERLCFLTETFPHHVWLNPVPSRRWKSTETIDVISRIFPMFELTLDGLEKAITLLMAK